VPNDRRREDGFSVSDDPSLLDIDVIHGFLTNSYWAREIPRAIVERSVANSLSFGVYAPGPTAATNGPLVGFGRVMSDRATFAYLADVFILEPYRGLGLSKFLMESIIAHPELQGLRSWMLLTGDAHGLYEKFGFARATIPERIMQRRPPVTYGRNAANSADSEGNNGNPNR